jgi:hypothetical protein
VRGFLSGLSLAVSALARFVLWDPNGASVPVHPRALKVRNLASSKAESACHETNESCFKVIWRRKAWTRFQQEFELAVSEDILVGVPSRERPPMTISPFCFGLVVMRHP